MWGFFPSSRVWGRRGAPCRQKVSTDHRGCRDCGRCPLTAVIQLVRSFASSAHRRGEAGIGGIEVVILLPVLFTIIFMFSYLPEFTLNYMSMSALAHESSEISTQTHVPIASSSIAMAAVLADETAYRTCLDQIRGSTPTEFCLVGVAQWRSEKLLRSLRLDEALQDLNLQTNYQPNGGEAVRPQLEVRISGAPVHLPSSRFAWMLSAEAIGALRE